MTAYDPKLQVKTLPIGDLKPYLRNARTHSQKQLKQIAASIETFGWTNPVLIDANGCVIAGHGRIEAAKLLGMSEVPTICLDHMTEAQKRAYIIADNKLAENADWDTEILALELQDLLDLKVDIDVTLTGFENGEIDQLIGDVEFASANSADEVQYEAKDGPTIVKLGELWMLGEHRVYCGDALENESWGKLMDGAKAQMVFTDPPYNVKIDGHVCGLGKKKHEEFAMAAGEMSKEQFTAFLEKVLGNLASVSDDGSIHYVCMDWRHLFELLTAGRVVYSELKNICVWNKTNGGMGSLYRSKHEMVAVFKNGKAPHINNVALGSYGRYRTNVWDYAGINSFGSDRDEALEMHPTVKPVALVEDAILDCSNRGGIVVDAFLGSGTTVLAAERSGRRAFAMELDPRYVDVALKRWRDMTGEEPVHAASGFTFGELE